MNASVPIIRANGEGDRQSFLGGGLHTWKLLAEETGGAFFLFEVEPLISQGIFFKPSESKNRHGSIGGDPWGIGMGTIRLVLALTVALAHFGVGKYPALDTELVLYCGGGFRSALAADNLQKMGYTNVTSMDGGMREWREKAYPLEKGK